MVVVALTTLRAAFDPTEKSSRHYEAAEAYADLGRTLSLFRDIKVQQHILGEPDEFVDHSFVEIESEYAEMDGEVTRLDKASVHLSPEFIDKTNATG